MKNAAVGLLLGSIGGVAYRHSGDYLFSTSREAWLLSRAKTVQTSTYKVVSRGRPTFVPYTEAKKLKDQQREEAKRQELRTDVIDDLAKKE